MKRQLLFLLLCASALASELAPRQDHDDDEEEEEEAYAPTLPPRNSPTLVAINDVPQNLLVPQFLNALTNFAGYVNQRLNGSDTPNVPSFIAKHGGSLFNQVWNREAPKDVPTPPSPTYIQKVPRKPSLKPELLSISPRPVDNSEVSNLLQQILRSRSTSTPQSVTIQPSATPLKHDMLSISATARPIDNSEVRDLLQEILRSRSTPQPVTIQPSTTPPKSESLSLSPRPIDNSEVRDLLEELLRSRSTSTPQPVTTQTIQTSTTPSPTQAASSPTEKQLEEPSNPLFPNKISLLNIYKRFEDIQELQRQFETTTNAYSGSLNAIIAQPKKTSKPATWVTKYYANRFPVLTRY